MQHLVILHQLSQLAFFLFREHRLAIRFVFFHRFFSQVYGFL